MSMTKKRYIAPQLEIVTLDTPVLMLTASGETGSAGTGSGSVGDETEDLSTRRRGTWGNLWEQ